MLEETADIATRGRAHGDFHLPAAAHQDDLRRKIYDKPAAEHHWERPIAFCRRPG